MKIFKWESGTLAKWLAIVFVGAAVISGLALLASGLPGAIRNGEEWPTVKFDPDRDLSFNASQDFSGAAVREVTADFSFENVRISASDDGDFHVSYEGAARNVDDWQDVFTMELRGDLLFIDSHWRGVPTLGTVKAAIEVPAGYSGNLLVDSGSGRLTAEGISAGALGIRLGSGNIDASALQAGALSLHTGSGGISINDIAADTVKLKAVSGSIRGDGLEADLIEARISSGRTVLSGISGSFVLDGSSGPADIEIIRPGKLTDIKLSSGGIDLSLPAGSEFRLDASTSSGRLTCDFPVAVSGDLSRKKLQGDVGSAGGGDVNIRTSSGSIRLTAK